MTWVDATRSVDATIAVYLDGCSCNELYLAEKIAASAKPYSVCTLPAMASESIAHGRDVH